MSEQSGKYAMKLNVKKTQVLVATKKKEEKLPVTDIRVNGLKLLQVKRFNYLDTAICWNVKTNREKGKRLAYQRTTFF